MRMKRGGRGDRFRTGGLLPLRTWGGGDPEGKDWESRTNGRKGVTCVDSLDQDVWWYNNLRVEGR